MAAPTGDFETTVVVVGGGLAGLTAARRLHRQNIDVRVLEANDRVGGRTLTRDVGGEAVDLGAQWIGPSQHHIHGLVEEFGIGTFDQFNEGESLIRAGGSSARHTDPIRGLGLASQLNLLYAIRQLDQRCREVPLDRPSDAPNADKWDAVTVATWRDRYLKTTAARAAFDAIFRALFTSEPEELSYLYFLFYLNAAGGFGPITAVEGGAQQTRLTGGTQQISQAMAVELGDRVHLGAPAHTINHDGGVQVQADDLTVTGEYAVVAIPPAMAGRIDYDPALPASRDGLTQRAPMGAVVKAVAAYDDPFWRSDDLSGDVLDAEGPVGLVFDDSPQDASHGALVAFALGDAARMLTALAGADRRRRILGALGDHFGQTAREPIDYADHAWTEEPYIRGCYAGNMAPGTLTSFDQAIREPCGRIHWAGTETAKHWCGYMDGAVASGKRAATEVGERLQ